jgi:hypothetical protein
VKKTLKYLALTLTILGTIALAHADDLTGSDTFICSILDVNLCPDDAECFMVPTRNLNIPQFVLVDLSRKMLSTTKASGQDRITPIKHLERDDGLIVIQGYEAGRAFSILITEETGSSMLAVAGEAGGVVGVGACTPTP